MGEPEFEESAEDLLEDAPCGYLSAAPDGMLLRVNRTFLRWTGYRREELVGVKRFQELLTVGGRIYHETHYAPMLRMQGVVREIAVDVVCADGRRLPVVVNSVLLRDADGAPWVVRTTAFDATERRSYERELLAARDRERTARENVERLQRLTARLGPAANAEAIASTVVAELRSAFGAATAGIAADDPQDGMEYDEGEPGNRGAAARVPLGVRGRLWLELAEARAFTVEERAFLEACAMQTGVALERARLLEQARDVAHTLQQSMLAGAPPHDPRFEVATLYHSAVEHLEVGGDWHDAFMLPDGRLGLGVGDVVGRGLRAASAMGQLRSAVRALASSGLDPAEVLTHLDTFVAQVDDARYATLVYAEVDPDGGELVLAAAGHMPPVIVAPDGGARLFMEGRSPPLGAAAPDTGRAQARVTLPPGAGLLLYTDGLVERRTEPLDAGLRRLLDAVRAAPGASPAQQVKVLPAALLEPGSTHDDVCLLSFRRTGYP
jgi:PAS domain S-box-containing protein